MTEVSQTRFPNADCPICRRQIGPDASVRSCLICELTCHEDCWKRSHGCATPGCRNREPEPSTGVVASDNVAAGPRTGRTRVATDALPSTQAVPVSRKPAAWTGPWLTALGAIVVTCVILTIIVGVVATKRKQARRELASLINTARTTENPREVVAALERYLQSDHPGRLIRIANEELSQARREVDDQDYQSAIALDRGEHTDLDRLENALTTYLERHPNGAYRREAEARLLRIPDDRDDREYQRAVKNAQPAGDDFGLQEAAWQTYLDTYPHGRHAAQARAEIARIPDQADQARFEEVLADVETLIAANRLTDALNRIDMSTTEVRSPPRHQELAERAQQIEARLEALDAAECLEPAGRGALARRSKLAQCRLYLLCYPAGASREKMEKVVTQLLARERDELLQELRRRLTTLADEPRAALEALYEFLEHPAAEPVELSRELARYHVELLCRSVADSLDGMKAVTLADGVEIVGTAKSASPGWIQIRPRPSGASGPRKTLLKKDTDAVIAEPPLLEECPRLRQRVLSMLADSNFDVGDVVREIRVTRDLARGEEYEPEWLAFQVCLAGIDPSNDEAHRELTQAGYVKRGGVYSPPIEPDAAAEDSPHKMMLDYYTAAFKSSAPVKEMRALLPDSFDYSFLGTTLSVPIEWQLKEPQSNSTLLSGGDNPFHGRVELVYPARATRASDDNLPPSILTELGRELASVSASTRVVVECEVRASPQHLTGVGIETRVQSDTLLVSHVFPGSSAARAGVEIGDRVVLVDGALVPPDATPESLATMIANAPDPGVKLVFMRAGRRFRLTLERSGYAVDKYEMRMSINARGGLVDDQEPRVSEWIDIPPPP
ncbi:MAG: hypothetical protein KKI02_04755 [Planctomycetes bacterium]|nr:hypothetical protein [Planctomycetota bacterium]